MKNLFFVVLISLIGFATQAQEKKNKNAKHEITVKGNCEMCNKRIEKAKRTFTGIGQESSCFGRRKKTAFTLDSVKK